MQASRFLLVLLAASAACDSGTKSGGGSTAGSAAPVATVDVPKVTRTPALILGPSGARVTVRPTAIEVNGEQVAALANGDVAATDKEGGTHGLTIMPLVTALGALAKDRQPLVVAMDRSLDYGLLVDVLFSARQKDAGFTSFLIAVTDGATELAIPLTLPSMAPVVNRMSPGAGGADGPVGPSSRITLARDDKPDATSLTSDAVIRKVQSAYLAGVKRCYTNALTRDPALKGKVSLTLTVGARGRVTDAKSAGFDKDVDACITNVMKAWMFAIPKAADGTPTDATFQVTLQLISDGDARPKPANEKPVDDLQRQLDRASGARGELDTRLLVDPDRQPLGLIVSITRTKILLWSMTGLEGTLTEPVLALPNDAAAITKLNAQLADIVKRRWSGKERPADTRSIIVQADREIVLQTIADVMTAVRTTADGTTTLFPEVELSIGFD